MGPAVKVARGAALALLWCAVTACTSPSPYQPAQARIDDLPADAFQRSVDVVRAQYPRLAVVEAEGFRIQSNWLPHQRGKATGSRRATVFLDDEDRINVVVETRYLGVSLLGNASWSSVRADPGLELELLQALVQVLERP